MSRKDELAERLKRISLEINVLLDDRDDLTLQIKVINQRMDELSKEVLVIINELNGN